MESEFVRLSERPSGDMGALMKGSDGKLYNECVATLVRGMRIRQDKGLSTTEHQKALDALHEYHKE